MIKAASVAGAAAWTAPVIIDSLVSPAAAATCATGSFFVAYESPGLAELFPNVTASGCAAPSGNNVHASAVGLTAVFSGTCGGGLGSIAHVASTAGNCQPVTLTISGCSNCTITKVQGIVHLRNADPTPTCPNPNCQTASTANHAPLAVTGGVLGTNTVTVAPAYTDATICAAAGIHWGSPNVDPTTGYLLVQVTCT